MTFEDETERAELALDDHAQARDNIRDAFDRVVDAGEEAEEAAEELYATAEKLEGNAAKAIGIFADYLMKDRKALDDEAVELVEDAEEIEDTVDYILDEAGVDNPDELYDALTPSTEHGARLARMRHMVDDVYFD